MERCPYCGGDIMIDDELSGYCPTCENEIYDDLYDVDDNMDEYTDMDYESYL